MLVPTIGIEVHIELKSKTKVYSDSRNSFNEEANTNVNVIDLGYPGTLPKLNKEVINMALKAALALNCKINQTMHFDRKNYFYPDLPKGYQITQSKTPIGYDGYITIEVDGVSKKIEIERLHIEEDTCKSIHSSEGTLLNFNRAGVPLIEIVTKPVIKSEKEAVAYIEALREILLYLEISDVKIEEGSMRCDANVSLSEEGSNVLGTKTEIKNIGSITNVATSIKYEIARQLELINRGEVIVEETRRFDDKNNTTIRMRVKETGNDYRYFPEPDLPPVIISDEWIKEMNDAIPLLPSELRVQYRSLGINENNIKTIISNLELCKFVEQIIKEANPVIACNLLTGDILSYLNKNNLTIAESNLTTANLKKVVKMLEANVISSKQVKDIIPELVEQKTDIEQYINSLGLVQISDTDSLQPIIEEVINDNPESIVDYKAGKDRAVSYLMGQIMKKTKGQANPQLVMNILIESLKTKWFDKW